LGKELKAELNKRSAQEKRTCEKLNSFKEAPKKRQAVGMGFIVAGGYLV
jgi:hypothetical protein